MVVVGNRNLTVELIVELIASKHILRKQAKTESCLCLARNKFFCDNH